MCGRIEALHVDPWRRDGGVTFERLLTAGSRSRPILALALEHAFARSGVGRDTISRRTPPQGEK